MRITTFTALGLIGFAVCCGGIVGYEWDAKKLRRTNAHLERMVEKAEEATKMKSMFLANVSGTTVKHYAAVLVLMYYVVVDCFFSCVSAVSVV